MLDPELYRPLFPYLSSGRIWFNHAATSPLSTRIVSALDKLIAFKSGEAIDEFPRFLDAYRTAKDRLGKLLGCPPARIAFSDNTSDGLNILASGIDCKPGDRIIIPTGEFPANVYPFLNLARRGVEIDFVPLRDGKILVGDIEALITPRTRLLTVSFVQFLTGFRANLEDLGALCRSRGVIFSVDAIQGTGAVPLDVVKAKIDFLSNGTQKWVMGLQGLSFIYITEELQERLSQAYMGWINHENFLDDYLNYHIHLDPGARRYENGSMSTFGVFALCESLDILLGVGIGNIHDHLITLTGRLLEGMAELGYETATPTDVECRSGIATFRAPDAGLLFSGLQKRAIDISLREGLLRISPHFYNSIEEVDRVLAAVKEIRDLPLSSP